MIDIENIICIRCNKKINPNKSYVASMHNDRIIGFMHVACLNKQFAGGEDDEETES
jgi:hypothetical protein